MIQTTADSGLGARLGANEAQIYAAGPILTYSFAEVPEPTHYVRLLSQTGHSSGMLTSDLGDNKVRQDHVIPHFALCHGGPASDKKRSSAKGTRGARNNTDDSQR